MKIPLKSEPLRLISDILQSAVYWCCLSCPLQLSCLVRGFNSNSQNRKNIFFIVLRHVGAKFALLLLFRKKSRSACLLGCKRPHDSSLSLSTFCDFERVPLQPPKTEKSFSCGSYKHRKNRINKRFFISVHVYLV